MLDQIRAQSSHWLIKVALGTIVLVFVFWGFGASKMNGGSETFAAKVNGREISLASFERDYRAKQEQRRAQTKGMMPSELDDKYVTQAVMDDLIEQELLLQYADEAGIYVSPAELGTTIKGLSFLKDDKGGEFIGREKYLEFLKERDIQVGDFEKDIERSERLRKTHEFIEGAIKVSADEVKDEFRLRNEKVNLSYLRVDTVALAASMKSQPVSAADLDAWTKANPGKAEALYEELKASRFTTAAKLELFQITVRKPNLAPGKKPTDDDVKSSKRRADRALELAKTDFKKAAEQFAEGAPWEKSGQAREFSRRELPVTIADKAFTMKAEDAAEMIETPTAYEIVKVKSVAPEKVTELDEALKKTLVEEEVRKARAAAAVETFAKEGFERLKKGESLEKIAASKGLQVKETGAFPHRDEIPGLPDVDATVVAEAFKLSKPGDVLAQNGAAPKAGAAWVLAVLKDHAVPNDADLEKQQGWIEMSLKRNRSTAAFNAWKADRLGKAKIVENQRLVSRS